MSRMRNSFPWFRLAPMGGGGIAGPNPASSTDNAVVRWDGATGTIIQDSVVIISNKVN